MRDHWSEFQKWETAALVISFGEPEALRDYQQHLRLPFPIAADPQRQAYAAYGVGRGPSWRIWSPRVLWRYVQLVAQGHKLQKPAPDEDLSQLGADFLITPTSQIQYTHLSKSPADRPPIKTLLNELGRGRT